MAYSNIFFLIAFILASCQPKKQSTDYNLSFEHIIKDSAIGWYANSRNDRSKYIAALDSTVVKDGRYSAAIFYKGGEPAYTTWYSIISEKYIGDSITLSGFIKTENVTNGHAGLWMRIDPEVAFGSTGDRGAKGSTEWTEYKVTLPLEPERTDEIYIGGILSGTGKMWMDDLKISIDGKPIANLKPINKPLSSRYSEFNDGSKIDIDDLDSNKIKTLYEVGLIWGFLKYYHPGVIKGNYNWDYELFRALPKILDARSNAEKNALLYKWIDTLGVLKNPPSQITNDSLILKPDLDWITQSDFSEELRKLLLKVRSAERPGNEQYYVTKTNTGNPSFKNELPYTKMLSSDDGFRLLTLYRYWNMVQYFFPYRDLIGEDWKNTLLKFIPKFLNANSYLEYQLTVLELAGQIHDTHASVDEDYPIQKIFGTRQIPVALRFINEKLVVYNCLNKNLGAKNPLQKGDIIIKINDKPVEEIIKKLEPYCPASNRWTLLRDIAKKITRTNDSTLQVEILRAGKEMLKTVVSYNPGQLKPAKPFSISNDPYKWVANGIGYIDNGVLKLDLVDEVFDKFKNAKGIIIDLRNYPSNHLVFAVTNHLLSKKTPFVKGSIPNISLPGSFYYMPPLEVGNIFSTPYQGEVVLLVDETTQSSSEFHAMAYRAYSKCTVIGSNTAGADGNVSEILLPGLPGTIKTRFSGIGIYYPDGTPTQRIGIVPDILVKPTISGIINNKDEVLDKAIKFLSLKK
ncbi:MAG: S41 family peptidase [Niabella sp.]